MVELTEPDASAKIDEQQRDESLRVYVNYIFMEAGKEVSHMFSFIAADEQQFNKYNQQFHSGTP